MKASSQYSSAVGRVPPPGGRDVPSPGAGDEPPPRRLRRLHRVWPDRDGNISYLLTLCVDGRGRVLDNETTFERFVAFLLDSPGRYQWFGRRFVVMPDHIHLIARMGHDAIRLGQWMKALKSVVGGLERREPSVGRVPSPGGENMPSPGADATVRGTAPAGSGDPAYNMKASPQYSSGMTLHHGSAVGRVPSPGGVVHQFTRIQRTWRWQDGFHDHKFRTPESEQRKWEYVCLNPVRAGFVKCPEEWPFGGEIFYDDAAGPRLVRGTPPLLKTGILVEETPGEGTPPTPREGTSRSPGEGTSRSPGEGTRPTI